MYAVFQQHLNKHSISPESLQLRYVINAQNNNENSKKFADLKTSTTVFLSNLTVHHKNMQISLMNLLTGNAVSLSKLDTSLLEKCDM